MQRDARTELGHPPRKISDRTLAAWAVAAIVVAFAYVAMPVPGVSWVYFQPTQIGRSHLEQTDAG